MINICTDEAGNEVGWEYVPPADRSYKDLKGKIAVRSVQEDYISRCRCRSRNHIFVAVAMNMYSFGGGKVGQGSDQASVTNNNAVGPCVNNKKLGVRDRWC